MFQVSDLREDYLGSRTHMAGKRRTCIFMRKRMAQKSKDQLQASKRQGKESWGGAQDVGGPR